jgi:murein DD-endopeptidase MepM/ murein hydrolase activator NlpD
MIRRRLSSWALAAMVAWVACGNEPAPSEDAPAEATPEPAAPEPAPVAVEAPVPRTEGISLLEPGTRGPAEVRWAPKVGSTERLIVSVRVNRRLGDKPSALEPRIRLALDTTVAASSGGKWRRTFSVAEAAVVAESKVDEAARTALQPFVDALVGHTGHVALDGQGQVEDYAFDVPAPADGAQSALLAAFELGLREHLVIVPAEAVGDGATWEVSRRASTLGATTWRVDRLGLRKRHGDQLEIRGDVLIPDEDVEGTLVGFDDLGRISELSGKGEVSGRFDGVRASPVETHLGVSLQFTVTDASGANLAGKVGIDVTVDEDYLSLRDSRVTLRGEFSQGGLIHGTVAPGTKVWLKGKRVRVSEGGDFLLGFGRDEKRRATLGFAFAGAPAERHVVHVGNREFDVERIDGLPEEMVNLDAATKKALARSRKQVSKVRDKTTKGTDFRDGWIMPVKGKITSTYGRKRILNGEDHGYHWGVDISAPVGKKVRAPAGGVVVLAEENVPLSGTLLIIDHGQGLTSSLLHLHRIKVKVGDTVTKGQVVAEAGKTGRVTGPHLDWRMNLHETRIDPMLVMKL